MKNTDTRVEDLLNSLVGCDFLLTLVESRQFRREQLSSTPLQHGGSMT
jgi:hypothetical protein